MVGGAWRTGLTPAALIAIGAARYPDRRAITDDSGSVTYLALDRRVEAVAAAIHARAGRPATVAVLCRNHRGFIVGLAAGTRLGAEVVLLNTELTESQLGRILARHSPDVLIHDEEYAGAIAAARYRGVRVVAWCDTPGLKAETLDNLAQERAGRAPAQHGSAKLTLLTSGTTGLAKGVSREVNPLAIVESAATGMGALRLRSGDVALIPAPFFHALGFALLISTLSIGGTVVTHRRFDADRTLRDIAEHRATVLTGVPVMFQRLIDAHREAPEISTSTIRVALTGASPISPTTIEAFVEAFGPVLVNVYGSTETGIVSMATPEDLAEAPQTLGRPGLGMSIRILRDDRSLAEPGERGTIFVRGGLMYSGYTSDGADTPASKEVVDGHVNTGDMGHLDAKGRLYIDGRDDDMIVSGGENVFPLEVEHTLAAHPEVDEAVVLGVEHEEFGQVLRAYVTPASGASIEPEELRTFVRDRLERFKVPREVVVIEEFPRNASGKILRKELL